MDKDISFIASKEMNGHFEGELPAGQGRSWQPGGQHFLYLQENNKKGSAEVHKNVRDIFYVLAGKPAFLLGGELIDPTKKEQGEFRAEEIRGGQVMVLKPGDTLVVPPGKAHQRLAHGKIFLLIFKDFAT